MSSRPIEPARHRGSETNLCDLGTQAIPQNPFLKSAREVSGMGGREHGTFLP